RSWLVVAFIEPLCRNAADKGSSRTTVLDADVVVCFTSSLGVRLHASLVVLAAELAVVRLSWRGISQQGIAKQRQYGSDSLHGDGPFSLSAASGGLIKRGPQALGELQGVVVSPEVHEDQPRLLGQHVAMDRGDLDATGAQRLDDRIDLLA